MAIRAFILAFSAAIFALPAFAAGDDAGLPQLDFSTWPTQIFWLFVTFLIAYLLMWRVVLPRIGRVLEDRHNRLEDDMERARQSVYLTDETKQLLEQSLASARSDAAALTASSLAEAAGIADEKNQAANTRLSSRLKAAEDKIMATREAALADLDKVASSSAVDVVLRLSGLKVSEADASKAVKAATAGFAKDGVS